MHAQCVRKMTMCLQQANLLWTQCLFIMYASLTIKDTLKPRGGDFSRPVPNCPTTNVSISLPLTNPDIAALFTKQRLHEEILLCSGNISLIHKLWTNFHTADVCIN